VAKRFLGF